MKTPFTGTEIHQTACGSPAYANAGTGNYYYEHYHQRESVIERDIQVSFNPVHVKGRKRILWRKARLFYLNGR